MKIKHYRAPDMRQALRQVRDAQGPDAVILSSRRIEGGVEVVAAVDYEEEGAGHGAWGAGQNDESSYATGFSGVASPVAATGRAQSHGGIRGHDEALSDRASSFEGRGSNSLPTRAPSPEPHAPSSMTEELRTLRQVLETQLATLAWNDLSRRSPLQAELLKQLTELGVAGDLAGELVAQMPSRFELAEAQRIALAQLARRIAVTDERWLDTGGVVAMVGPTGVGKTTLIAKLAARWVMRHGPRSLALVSADSVRIGAQEQIHTLGRLLGVPAYGVDGVHELPELLDRLADRRLVLIDTAGLSQRDSRLAAELQTLAAANHKLEITLVLSAAAQAGAIEEAVLRFAPARPGSCVLTKLDEATSLGGAMSMLIRSGLPLAYLSDGQAVPEDLSVARAHQLIARAVELSRKAGAMADEDLLQRRFGAVARVLA
ncbi:MAG TPA: flagellar biosynthesis protein FlhF [Povalibacter sp.]|nr:flagellar biosynthesis protein FlhF [Povalibacter sp.]